MFTTGGLNTLIEFIPRDLRQKEWLKNWSLFQADIDKRLRIYHDDWKRDLAAYIITQIDPETAAHFFYGQDLLLNPNATAGFFTIDNLQPLDQIKWPLPIHLNILKRIVQETSLVYNSAPTRSFCSKEPEEKAPTDPNTPPIEEEEHDSERFAEITAGDFNIKMQLVNELVNLCNIVLVLPQIDMKTDTGFRFDILTPDQFTPIQDPDNPAELIGFTYVVDMTDTPNESSNINTLTTRCEYLIYMGRENEEPFIVKLENTPRSEPIKLPYPYYYQGKKYLPCVFFRKHAPLTGEFVDRTRGDDLVNATLIGAYMMSLFIRSFAENNSKKLVIIGPKAASAPKSFNRDNLAMWQLAMAAEDAKIEQIDLQVDLLPMYEALQKYIESIITAYGITMQHFNAMPVAKSGISIKLENEKLIGIIKKQWPFYYLAEKQLAENIRKMNNSLFTLNQFEAIPDDYEFEMDFGELPFQDDPMDSKDMFDWLLSKNITNLAELAFKFNPDLGGMEAAMDYIRDNKKINRELQGMGGSFAPQKTALVPEPAQTPPPMPMEKPMGKMPPMEDMEEMGG